VLLRAVPDVTSLPGVGRGEAFESRIPGTLVRKGSTSLRPDPWLALSDGSWIRGPPESGPAATPSGDRDPTASPTPKAASVNIRTATPTTNALTSVCTVLPFIVFTTSHNQWYPGFWQSRRHLQPGLAFAAKPCLCPKQRRIASGRTVFCRRADGNVGLKPGLVDLMPIWS
jgi:hypothetical protein